MDPDDDDFHTDMTSEVQEEELLDYVDDFEDTMTQVIDAGEKESDNESVFSQTLKRGANLRSGVLEKPRSQVMLKLKWPHMNQNPRYVTAPLTFNELTFSQFVGGECRTIIKADNPDEIFGRLKILSKIAYLHEQCRSWDKAHVAYFAILSSIEEAEADWNSSFGLYDMMCPPPLEMETQKPYQKQPPRPRNTVPKKDFFCQEFQRGECNITDPHQAWIKNGFEQVEHFCAQCYRARQGKMHHIPGSEACTSKK